MANNKRYLLNASLLALTLFSLVSLPAYAEKRTRTRARDSAVGSLEQECKNDGASSTLADYTTGKVTCGWSNGDTRECEVFSNAESICEDTPARATNYPTHIINPPARVFYR